MSKRSVSIYDIAQLAGVSTATVSNVLNEKGSYSEKTRDLVLRIAHEQGYVANFAAKSLRRASTQTIALITPDVSNDFFSTLVLQVEGELRASGYASYICNTANDARREAHYVQDLISKQVDGIVYIGGITRAPIEASVDIPVVHIDHRGATGVRREVFVANDFARLSYDMTATLARHGCQRIALASVSASLYHRTRRDIAPGYYSCLEEAGIPLDETLLLEGPHNEPSLVEAERMVGTFLDAGNTLDGVVALGDRVALGVVNALAARNINVGSDVRVIGMDNSIYSRISSPAISTVDRHTHEMVQAGVSALMQMLAGDEPASRSVSVGYDVIERATTLSA